MRNDTLTIALEARWAMWYPNGDSLQGREVEVFAEEGKAPLVPGPLVRVPVGTTVILTVRNTESQDTLVFLTPSHAHGLSADTTYIPPRERREVRYTATKPGNFHYHATASDPLSRFMNMRGLLGGALIVDSAGVSGPPRDRVFVMLWSIDSLAPMGSPSFYNLQPVRTEQPLFSRAIFSINGLSWPHTEHLTATVGDTLRWRVVNVSGEIHPMHLHGSYFRVDEYSGLTPSADGQDSPGRMAVTERLPQFSGATLTWVPERAGNWLFHCHFATHVLPLSAVSGGAARFFAPPERPTAAMASHTDHAATGMGGLVLGIAVSPKRGATMSDVPAGRRQVRLVATQDSGFPNDAPSMRFKLSGVDRGSFDEKRLGISPTLYLRRGEPVSVTIVNSMREETAVHWHGIELESYYDGVAGFGGFGSRVAPIIAPGDSFEARFTPPRSGTFIYHSHVNEPRQHRAGLLGALIVTDSGPGRDEVIVLLKQPRAYLVGEPSLEINGQLNPDTVVVRAGHQARFRLISLTYTSPGAMIWLTARPDSSGPNIRDSMVVQWKPIAKDGADLPTAQRTPRLARQLIGMGETYDFEFTPPKSGHYRIEVRQTVATGKLTARLPIRVQ